MAKEKGGAISLLLFDEVGNQILIPSCSAFFLAK